MGRADDGGGSTGLSWKPVRCGEVRWAWEKAEEITSGQEFQGLGKRG